MKDKTKYYIEVIKTGNIDEIQEFALIHFHEVKHTESFSALIQRLRSTEELLANIVINLDKLNSDIYGIKNLIQGWHKT
jgi:hypothetical protein